MKFIMRTLLLVAVLAMPAISSAGVFVSVDIAPPPLPVYAQPVCPGDGYIWTPGYWAWDGDEYYWVPGTWVLAPEPDLFWTPGYWGWDSGFYAWHAGYWGPHVGFYGGVNYGYGYGGNGYQGGRWEGGHFHYNQAVNNINVVNIHNTYNAPVNDHGGNRVSFNGGDGGLRAQPSAAERSAANERRFGVTGVQQQHEQAARNDGGMRFSQNHGNPAVAATPRPSTGGAMQGSQGHMPSSNFAPHQQRGRPDNGPAQGRVEMPHEQRSAPAPRPQEMPRGPGPGPQMNRPQGEPMHGGPGPGARAPRPQPQEHPHEQHER